MAPYLTFILRPIVFYAVTLVLFLVQKYLFIIFYPEIFRGLTVGNRLNALWHGIGMDASVAGYVTVLPLLLSMVTVWFPERQHIWRYQLTDGPTVEVSSHDAIPWKRYIRKGVFAYSLLIAFILSSIAILDAALYPAWGFKLDSNPFYYFFSAPGTVIKGLSTAQICGGLLAIVAVTVVWFSAYYFTWCQMHFMPINSWSRKILTFLALLVMGGLLFISIRGGLTVSTMNLSRAYFSEDQRMNHAAINPAFSLLNSSLRKSSNFDKYMFFPTSDLPEMLSAIAPVSYETLWAGADSTLTTHTPDIYIIILESFSSHLLPSLGGEAIAVNLEQEAQEGLLFTNAYANAFRTDRALPAILRAFPGIPEQGVMKNIRNIERLPSLGLTLKRKGYETEFFYGGDLSFTNLKAMIVSGGYNRIVGDSDFPLSQRLGKWGVQDHTLLQLIKEEPSRSDRKPLLRVIQTSSSHEPFEVPFHKHANPPVNAFAYTDSVVGDYMRFLRRSPDWDKALVVLVPDHYGAYPGGNLSLEERHRIPIIFTGGALKLKGTNDVPMTQADIVPTLFGMMGINHDQFFFGRNVLDPREPRMVYYYDSEWAYLRSDQGEARLNTGTLDINVKLAPGASEDDLSPLNPATQLQAWLQALASIYEVVE